MATTNESSIAVRTDVVTTAQRDALYPKTGEQVFNTTKGILEVYNGSAWVPANQLVGYTVATLPTGVEGDRAYVTDATAPTYNGALTGGGAVVVPVFRNATIWVSA